jgi:WXG100 family type VII secretion target
LDVSRVEKGGTIMAGQIRMSPDELDVRARRYGQGSEQITSVLSQLENLQSQLTAEWEGRAFEGFNEQWQELRPKVQSFAELLMAIQNQLQETARAMKDHDEALSRNFGLK